MNSFLIPSAGVRRAVWRVPRVALAVVSMLTWGSVLDAATWRAGQTTAPLPTQVDPPWILTSPAGVVPGVDASQGLVVDAAAGQRIRYERRGADVSMGSSFWMSAGLSVPVQSGSPANAVPASLGFIRADGKRAVLHIAPGRVYVTADAEGDGTGAQAGPSFSLDTSVLRAYRLEFDDRTAPGVVVVKISGAGGTTIRTPMFTGAAAQGPALFFGALHGSAGRAVWKSVGDNAAGTPFSYQGRLNYPRATPANGTFDFEFQLWDSPEGGTQLGTTRSLTAVPVKAGVFSVDLNFGTAVLTDLDPWMAIAVRPAGPATAFTALMPRVPIRPVPLALQISEPPARTAVTGINGMRGDLFLEAGQGLNLVQDPVSKSIRLDLASTGGTTPHTHFGEAWEGSSLVAGLSLNNLNQSGAALRLRSTGELLQAFGPTAGLPPVARISGAGEVAARSFIGDGSRLTNLAWTQLPGVIPLDLLPQIPRSKLPPDLGGGGGTDGAQHFAQKWSGSSTSPGLWIDNTATEGVALYGSALGVVGTGVRGSGQRAGVEGSGTAIGVAGNSAAGSALYGLTESGAGLELIASGGDFIRGTKRFTGQTFRVADTGDVFARSFSGRGSDLTGLSWGQLSGTIPVEKLPSIPRDKLPADLGGGSGGAEHTHFGQVWRASAATALTLVNTNESDSSLVLGLDSQFGRGLFISSAQRGIAVASSRGEAIRATAGGNNAGIVVYGAGTGAGLDAKSTAGAALSGQSTTGSALELSTDSGDLILGRVGFDLRFQVDSRGRVSASGFNGDGSGLINLNWNALSGQIAEYQIPDAIARTNHNHVGAEWSGAGTVLTLQGGIVPDQPTLKVQASDAAAIRAESVLGTAVLARTSTQTGSAVQGSAQASGKGVYGQSVGGIGVLGESRSGAGVTARSEQSSALRIEAGAGLLIDAVSLAAGGPDPRFSVANNGDVLTTGAMTATAFNTTSDRNAKTGFTPIDPLDVLRKVSELAITRWTFTNSTSIPHIGPVAQDFHRAFGVGSDDRHIATVDADGVALAAIQGLNVKLDAALRSREAEVKALRSEVEDLKSMIRHLVEERR